MENLLSCCSDIADQVNELGACVYTQDASEMQSSIKRLYNGINGMCKEIGNLGGSPENTFAAFQGFEKSLGVLEEEIAKDVANGMKSLSISQSLLLMKTLDYNVMPCLLVIRAMVKCIF
jgi:hypothetical protein